MKNKTIKKFLSAVLVAAMSVSLLAGCGGSTPHCRAAYAALHGEPFCDPGSIPTLFQSLKQPYHVQKCRIYAKRCGIFLCSFLPETA